MGPIVVGYDGREESELALQRALSEAARRKLPVVVLIVGELPVDPVNPLEPGEPAFTSLMEITEDGPVTVKPIVDAARRVLAEAGVQGRVEWTLGDPASEIVRFADDCDATAIVVGTHHHSALGRLFGADIAAAVIRHAGRDVIVAQ